MQRSTLMNNVLLTVPSVSRCSALMIGCTSVPGFIYCSHKKIQILTTATNVSQAADLAVCKSVSRVLSLDDAVAFSIKSLVDLCSLSFCFLRCRYQRTAYPGTISIVTEVICGHVCGAMSDRSCSTKRYIESPEISATCIHLGCIREAGTL